MSDPLYNSISENFISNFLKVLLLLTQSKTSFSSNLMNSFITNSLHKLIR